MPYTVQLVPGEPAILAKLIDRFDPKTDQPALYAEIAALMEQTPGIAYRILDMTDFHPSFADTTLILEQVRHGTPGSPSDAQLTSIYVGSEEVAGFYAKTQKQTQYGARDILVFSTVDEALAYVRGQH